MTVKSDSEEALYQFSKPAITSPL